MTDPHELSGLYALDALDDAERLEYEAHLTGCAPCRREVAEFRATMAVVASVVDHDDIVFDDIAFDADAFDEHAGDAPPPALRSRVLHDITGVDDAIGPVVPITAPRRRRAAGGAWSPARWMPAAAAAIVIIAIVGVVLATRDGTQSELALLAELRSNGSPSVTMTSQDGARLEGVTVVVSAAGDRAVIDAKGLAPLDDEHVYQAWTIDADHEVVPAPLFRPDASGNAVVALRSLPDHLDTVAVTIEPRSGSKLPTTPVLMSAKVA